MPDSPASASRELRLYTNPGLHVPQANTLPAELHPSSVPVYLIFVAVFFLKFGAKDVHFPATKLQFCRSPSNPFSLLDPLGLLGRIVPVFFPPSSYLFSRWLELNNSEDKSFGS